MALSAKRGITDKVASDDEVVITGSKRRTVIKTEVTSSSQGRILRNRTVLRSDQQSSGAERTSDRLSDVLADLNLRVFPRDKTLLLSDDSPEVIQTIQGGLLRVRI